MVAPLYLFASLGVYKAHRATRYLYDANALNLDLYPRTAKNNIPCEQKYVLDSLTSSKVEGSQTTLVIAAHVDNSGQKIIPGITFKIDGTI